jgi:hypothetical protein
MLVPALLAGCAGATGRVEVSTAHPAHPDAEEAPVPEPAQTLAVPPARPEPVAAPPGDGRQRRQEDR